MTENDGHHQSTFEPSQIRLTARDPHNILASVNLHRGRAKGNFWLFPWLDNTKPNISASRRTQKFFTLRIFQTGTAFSTSRPFVASRWTARRFE
jgi:hypothetical protein